MCVKDISVIKNFSALWARAKEVEKLLNATKMSLQQVNKKQNVCHIDLIYNTRIYLQQCVGFDQI